MQYHIKQAIQCNAIPYNTSNTAIAMHYNTIQKQATINIQYKTMQWLQ